jgi:hypothetical protein
MSRNFSDGVKCRGRGVRRRRKLVMRERVERVDAVLEKRAAADSIKFVRSE